MSASISSGQFTPTSRSVPVNDEIIPASRFTSKYLTRFLDRYTLRAPSSLLMEVSSSTSDSENPSSDSFPTSSTSPTVLQNPTRTDLCFICSKSVDRHDSDTWKQVIGFVGGPRKDSMRLRADTGFFAHNECVQRKQRGVAEDQAELSTEIDSTPPLFDTDADDLGLFDEESE